jgi:hypothetical protein
MHSPYLTNSSLFRRDPWFDSGAKNDHSRSDPKDGGPEALRHGIIMYGMHACNLLPQPERFCRRDFLKEFGLNIWQTPSSQPQQDKRQFYPQKKPVDQRNVSYDGFNVKDA